MAPPTSILSAAEASYILDSLLLGSPIRTDGRPLVAFRPFSLATAVAPQANGSARVLLGGGPTGRGATEVVCAVRLEVGPPPPPSAMAGEGASAVGARPDVVCSVECAPGAFPHLDYKAVEAQSQYLTTLVQHVLPSFLPLLPITPHLSFHYTVDLLVTSSTAGNVIDGLFIACRAALADLRVPATRNVAFEANLLGEQGESDMAGIKMAAVGAKKKRAGGEALAKGAEFELVDGGAGEGGGDRLASEVREALPVCITLHILPNGTHLLDPTPAEALACPAHLLVFVSASSKAKRAVVAGLRLVGSPAGELGVKELRALTEAAQTIGLELIAATNAQLKSLTGAGSSSSAGAAGMEGGLGFFGS